MEVLEALNQFRIYCSCCRLEHLEGGFINDTYRVINSNGKKDNYLLQRVNHNIFMDANVLMKNISSILNYLYLNEASTRLKSINLVETKQGSYYYRDRTWHYWRLFQIPGRFEMRNIAIVNEDAYQWARAFGRFLSCLDEFPIQSPREITFGAKGVIDKLKNFERLTDPTFVSKIEGLEDEVDYLFRWVKQAAILDQMLESKNAEMEWYSHKRANII